MVVGATFTKKEMEDERLRNELEVMGDRDGIQQSATHNGSSVFNKTYGNTVPNNSLRPTAVEQKKANECEMRPLVVDDLEADEYVMELPVTEDSEVCSSGTYFRAMVKNYPTLLKNHKEEAFI
ncbi:hypothetical protein V6Z11_A10G261200 [Gossypium hirsutum]